MDSLRQLPGARDSSGAWSGSSMSSAGRSRARRVRGVSRGRGWLLSAVPACSSPGKGSWPGAAAVALVGPGDQARSLQFIRDARHAARSRKHADTQRRLCGRLAEPVIGDLTCQDIKASHSWYPAYGIALVRPLRRGGSPGKREVRPALYLPQGPQGVRVDLVDAVGNDIEHVAFGPPGASDLALVVLVGIDFLQDPPGSPGPRRDARVPGWCRAGRWRLSPPSRRRGRSVGTG